MPNHFNNVLLPIALPTQKSLRAAVAAIIRDIQRDAGESDQDTADRLGCSAGTIANARNEKADLNAATIARIGAIYGAHYVDPYHGLYGCSASPVQAVESDPLPALASAVASLCSARNDSGTATPKAQLDYLPTLMNAAQHLNAHIAMINKLRVAA